MSEKRASMPASWRPKAWVYDFARVPKALALTPVFVPAWVASMIESYLQISPWICRVYKCANHGESFEHAMT